MPEKIITEAIIEEEKNIPKSLKLPKRFTFLNENNCCVWVQYDYLTQKASHELLFHCQKDITWIQHNIKVWNKDIPLARLTCSLGRSYQFSGNIHPKSEWTDLTKALRDCINNDLKTAFNQCLMNKYRNGNDSIGAHSDEIKYLSGNGIVAGISLGATRTLILSEKKKNRKIKFALPAGSLFVMEGDTQLHWKHGIPKDNFVTSERVSLTFREFKE